MAKETKNISQYFLFLALGLSLFFTYLIYKPFLSVFLLAALFASIMYPVYTWLQKLTKGRDTIAALLSVLLFVLVILIPLGNFVILLARESAQTYALMEQKFTSGEINLALSQLFDNIKFLQKAYLPFVDLAAIDLKQLVLDLGGQFNAFVLSGASALIVGTTQFVTNLFFLLLTMFFLFKDGRSFAERVSYLTPMSSKYDRKLFDKFREVSRATILSSLVMSLVQGTLASIAYLVVGLPALFLGVATGVASLIPIVGTTLVTIPVLIALAIMGEWVSFIIVAIWCLGIVGVSDNVVRTLVIKGQSQIHPLLVFFSILGGISAFGVNGIFFGPLILAIMLTMLHIYELEYESILER